MSSLKIIFIGMLLCWTGLSYGAEMAPGHLKISFELNKDSRSESKKIIKAAKSACDVLGKALLVGQGPWGFGSFQAFHCLLGNKIIFGQQAVSPWLLRIVEKEKEINFELSFDSKILNKLTFPSSERFLEFLSDGEFVDGIAYSILDGLPIGMQLSQQMISGNPPIFTGRHWRSGRAPMFKFSVPQPPETIVFYRLAWEPDLKIWQSIVVGTAKMVEIKPPLEVKVNKKKRLKGGQVVYQVAPEVVEALAAGPVWGQNADGPGAKSAELSSGTGKNIGMLNDAAESGYLKDFLDGKSGIVQKILNTAASGYVGMRYGVQVLPSKGYLGDLFEKTSVFSLLLEIRGGPVKGLRYYYDKLPEKTIYFRGANEEEFTSKVAFARHVVGYSFGIDVGKIIDRVTIDPKLGMWDFAAVLPALVDEDGLITSVEDFDLGRTFSVAMEVGLEKATRLFTLRGWYAIDTGFSLLKSGGKVTSNRVGIDSYFNVGPKFPLFGLSMKTAIVGFYVFENVSLVKGKKEDLSIGESEISGLSYAAGYAGGGVALSW